MAFVNYDRGAWSLAVAQGTAADPFGDTSTYKLRNEVDHNGSRYRYISSTAGNSEQPGTIPNSLIWKELTGDSVTITQGVDETGASTTEVPSEAAVRTAINNATPTGTVPTNWDDTLNSGTSIEDVFGLTGSPAASQIIKRNEANTAWTFAADETASGEGGIDSATANSRYVRYDTAQTLTEDQKARARDNIQTTSIRFGEHTHFNIRVIHNTVNNRTELFFDTQREAGEFFVELTNVTEVNTVPIDGTFNVGATNVVAGTRLHQVPVSGSALFGEYTFPTDMSNLGTVSLQSTNNSIWIIGVNNALTTTTGHPIQVFRVVGGQLILRNNLNITEATGDGDAGALILDVNIPDVSLRSLVNDDGAVVLDAIMGYTQATPADTAQSVVHQSEFRWSFHINDASLANYPAIGEQVWHSNIAMPTLGTDNVIRGRVERREDIGDNLNFIELYIGHQEDRDHLNGLNANELAAIFDYGFTNTETREHVVTYTNGVGGLRLASDLGGMGSTTFQALTDTPANYTGAGGQFLRVNSGATAVEFVDAPSGGELTAQFFHSRDVTVDSAGGFTFPDEAEATRFMEAIGAGNTENPGLPVDNGLTVEYGIANSYSPSDAQTVVRAGRIVTFSGATTTDEADVQLRITAPSSRINFLSPTEAREQLAGTYDGTQQIIRVNETINVIHDNDTSIREIAHTEDNAFWAAHLAERETLFQYTAAAEVLVNATQATNSLNRHNGGSTTTPAYRDATLDTARRLLAQELVIPANSYVPRVGETIIGGAYGNLPTAQNLEDGVHGTVVQVDNRGSTVHTVNLRFSELELQKFLDANFLNTTTSSRGSIDDDTPTGSTTFTVGSSTAPVDNNRLALDLELAGVISGVGGAQTVTSGTTVVITSDEMANDGESITLNGGDNLFIGRTDNGTQNSDIIIGGRGFTDVSTNTATLTFTTTRAVANLIQFTNSDGDITTRYFNWDDLPTAAWRWYIPEREDVVIASSTLTDGRGHRFTFDEGNGTLVADTAAEWGVYDENPRIGREVFVTAADSTFNVNGTSYFPIANPNPSANPVSEVTQTNLVIQLLQAANADTPAGYSRLRVQWGDYLATAAGLHLPAGASTGVNANPEAPDAAQLTAAGFGPGVYFETNHPSDVDGSMVPRLFRIHPGSGINEAYTNAGDGVIVNYQAVDRVTGAAIPGVDLAGALRSSTTVTNLAGGGSVVAGTVGGENVVAGDNLVRILRSETGATAPSTTPGVPNTQYSKYINTNGTDSGWREIATVTPTR